MKQYEGCTFNPVTHTYVTDKTNDLLGLDYHSDYKIVFSGQTFDLSSEANLQQFFSSCIDRSGQRSIFKKNYEKLNKLYSVAFK